MNRDTVVGNEKQFKSKVQEGYGITKDAAERQIRRLDQGTNKSHKKEIGAKPLDSCRYLLAMVDTPVTIK
jgi:hypothetical protein